MKLPIIANILASFQDTQWDPSYYESSYLMFPVSLKGVDPLLNPHITIKYFDDALRDCKIVAERAARLWTTPPDPKELSWHHEVFGPNKDTHVMQLEGVPDAIEKLHWAFEDIRKDDFPEFKPHISLPQEYCEEIVDNGFTPVDLDMKIGPLSLMSGRVVLWRDVRSS